MKKLLLIIPIVLFCTIVHAQPLIKTFIGGGVSLPNFKYSNNYGKDAYPRSMNMGYTVGAFAKTSLFGSRTGMTFGLNYLQAGAIDNAPLNPLYKETNVRLNYLQGEFYFSSDIKFIEFCGGLYLNSALSGKKSITKADGTTSSSDIKFGIYSENGDEMHRTDFGYTLKTIVNISKLKLILGYYKGFDNISTVVEENVQNKVFTAAIAFPIF